MWGPTFDFTVNLPLDEAVSRLTKITEQDKGYRHRHLEIYEIDDREDVDYLFIFRIVHRRRRGPEIASLASLWGHLAAKDESHTRVWGQARYVADTRLGRTLLQMTLCSPFIFVPACCITFSIGTIFVDTTANENAVDTLWLVGIIVGLVATFFASNPLVKRDMKREAMNMMQKLEDILQP